MFVWFNNMKLAFYDACQLKGLQGKTVHSRIINDKRRGILTTYQQAFDHIVFSNAERKRRGRYAIQSNK
jgi:hypothetical protein